MHIMPIRYIPTNFEVNVAIGFWEVKIINCGRTPDADLSQKLNCTDKSAELKIIKNDHSAIQWTKDPTKVGLL